MQNGLTALHLASKEGHVHVVAELLRRDADIDMATKVRECWLDMKVVVSISQKLQLVLCMSMPVIASTI